MLSCPISSRFSDDAVKLLFSSSIFNPASFPGEKEALTDYGNNELQVLVYFYGKEATAEFGEVTVTSPPLVDGEKVFTEWRLFKRAFALELKSFMEKKALREKGKNCKLPTLEELKGEMEGSGTYSEIFPEIFKLLEILLALPVGTATVERSLSEMKLVKTRLRNRLSDSNLSRLMRFAIEGPELSSVDFNEILDVYLEQNRRILL